MRLIVILLVVVVIGFLAVSQLRTQSSTVGAAARKAGVDVPEGVTPHEQVEAVGHAIEKIQQDQAAQQRRRIDEAEKGE